ncbi:hypothetical protein BsWGS_18219 [Bradybaena similaris]
MLKLSGSKQKLLKPTQFIKESVDYREVGGK